MKEQLIEFNTAVLAEKKGFDEDTQFHYVETDTEIGLTNSGEPFITGSFVYDAPTQSLLQKWLREKVNISVSIIAGYTEGKHMYECWVMYNGSIETEPVLGEYRDEKYGGHTFEWKYEDALEKGLLMALNLMK